MRPSIQVLTDLLSSVLPGFDNIYIVVDALDECTKADGSRERLMDVLVDVLTWEEESLHIFLTSRKEIDIGRALDSCTSLLAHKWCISLQPEDIVDDIQVFIRRSLQRRSFSKWKEALKVEVEEALSSRAQGS